MTAARAALREWGPAVVVGVLAVLSIEMLRSSYVRWQAVLEDAVVAANHLSASQQRLLRAYLIQDRQDQDDATFEHQSALAELRAAEHDLENWLEGRAGIGGFRGIPPTDSTLVRLGREYRDALADFGAVIAGGNAVSVRRAFALADQRATALESAVHGALAATMRAEADAFRLRLGGWGAVLLLTGLGLVLARRARLASESARDRSESRLARVLRFAPVGIAECDDDGAVHAANARWSEMTGHSEAWWEGRSWWEALDPADRERGLELWRASLRTPGDVSGEFRVDGGRTGGPELWVVARTASAPDPAGVRRWVVTFVDVTDRRQAQAQLYHAQRLEAVGRLASGVAHDFNNLLASIGGFAALARDGLEPGGAIDRDLAEIERSVGRGRALTRQLLTFSRQERIHPEVVDVREVVTGMDRLLEQLVGGRAELVLRAGDAAAPVVADRGQLEQVVTNLVVNAADASRPGGRIRVAVGRVRFEEALPAARSRIDPGDYVLLSVTDQGSGIPREVQERMFEPFFTTKERGKGTGLGLSTVWGIVSQAGGHVHVFSAPERGTVFKIYLPAVAGAAPVADDAAPVSPGAGERLAGTAVVVEDQEAVRRLTARILELRGWTVIEAADGESALGRIRDHDGPLDLLITDISMRGMDGPELVRRLRAEGRRIPTLFVSGYADSEVSLEGEHFLEKPFSPDALARAVAEVIRAARAGG